MSFRIAVVDTTVWIDYLRGITNPETEWLDANLDVRRLGLTDISLCEVLQGAVDEADASKIENKLLNFHIFETGGPELARAAARNYRTLRGHGYTVRKTIDCLIATFCLREDLPLLHRDRDFDPFEKILDLTVIHP